MKSSRKLWITTAYCTALFVLSGCSQNDTSVTSASQPLSGLSAQTTTDIQADDISTSASVPDSNTTSTYRDNTPECLVPSADGTHTEQNKVAVIDYSHADKGYIMARYTGDIPIIKLRITGSDHVDYTYNLHPQDYETFPLSSGDGHYSITIFENISGTSYSTCLHTEIDVTMSDMFSPFLYPNQYVNFTVESDVVKKGQELSQNCETDLDVIKNIYDYITKNITYDYQKAENPPSGYVSDPDETLHSGTGICLDYAAVMASMLRSQRIPTRLEVGYAKDAYHAWISIYTEDTGWLNGIVEFDGRTWTLVDPTFGANSSEKALKKFIGEGDNYTLQKVY